MGSDCISYWSLLIFLLFKFLVSKVLLHDCQELEWLKTQRFIFLWLEIRLIVYILNLSHIFSLQ